MSGPARERAVPLPVSPLGDRAAVAVVGTSQLEVAREALKIARAESHARPVLLVDLLGQGSMLDRMFDDDDHHGVSDAARYGLSLARVARQVPDADSLFVVPGGLESPLADDVLSDHMWGSWSEQCRRAGALLVVAAPADLPAVAHAIDQLEGVVLVGDATAPRTQAPLIGRVHSPRRGPVDVAAPRRITPEEIAVARLATARRAGWLAVAAATVAIALASGVWWAVATGRLGGSPSPAGGAARLTAPGDVGVVRSAFTPAPVGPAAEWAVEMASTNTWPGAMARVRQAVDSLPVVTLAATRPGPQAALWYRLIAGAFPRQASADSLLAALRSGGVVEAGGGRVVRAPLAWLLEERIPGDQVPGTLRAWRERGLPAYALFDPAGLARVYVGAFETEEEGRLLQPALDSLTLHATLAPRVGSIR